MANKQTNYDQIYVDGIRTIVREGIDKADRTSVGGNRSIFGYDFKFQIEKVGDNEFTMPFLQLRRFGARIAFHELIWMLNGWTHTDYLKMHNISIWDGNTSEEYLRKIGKSHIDVDTIGKGYGHQFRDFNGTDQLSDVYKGLMDNPLGRRHVISLWNPADIPDMALEPCFLNSTNVLMADGKYKSIEKIEEGEFVESAEGNHKKVTRKFKTEYKKSLQRLKVADHPVLYCTDRHPFYKKGVGYVDAKDIQHGDYIKSHTCSFHIKSDNIPSFEIEKTTKVYEQEITRVDEIFRLDNKEKWYLLGYFMGNGYTNSNYESQKKHSGTISIPVEKETEILNKIGDSIQLWPKTDGRSWTEKMHTYIFSSKKWAEIFRLFGHGAHNKIVPDIVFDSPKWAQESFLDGYIDSDGCSVGSYIDITTTSPSIAFSIKELCGHLKKSCMITKQIRDKKHVIEGRSVNQKNTYTIKIRKNEPKRKKKDVIFEDGVEWVRVKSNTPVESKNVKNFNGFVYNLEVEDDHTYVVEGIDTHNCHWAYEFYYANGTLNIHQHLRSNDWLLGQPYNAAFAAMFLVFMSRSLKMEPGTVWFTGTDVHMYDNQYGLALKCLSEDVVTTPATMTVNRDLNSLDGILELNESDVEFNYRRGPVLEKVEMAV